MRTDDKESKPAREEPTLGKRHDYGSEPQENIRRTAASIGFNAEELEELTKIYKGRVDNI